MAAGIVIVGGGECGGRTAFALREAGYAGPVTLIGAERHLPYERPPLSKEALAGEAVALPKTIFAADQFAAAGIRRLAGVRAVAIDRRAKRVALSDGTALAYERLLLATGADARRLALPGADDPRVMTLRTHDDAVKIAAALHPGARLAVIGGGFIGLELAAAAQKREAAVTVVEALPRVLARAVPETIATVVAARHEAAGVRILTGSGVTGFRPGDGAIAVELASGERLDADLVVVGIGAVPVIDLAAGAGLGLDNGIAVDATLQTSDPAIFAAGDCISFPHPLYGGRRIRLESWRNALDHAALAARNLLGAGEAVSAVPWFWSDQHDLTLQIAGLPDEGAETVRRDLGDGAFLLFHLAADGRLVAASGIGPGNAVARDVRLAEMLIAKAARPDPAALASPSVRLRALLAA
jgi:3-phenylpropionate/trans-cinnamate dioxygenase ferredoxin reductase subunit